MKKAAFAVITALCIGQAYAAEQKDWVKITSSDTCLYEAKTDSLKIARNDGGEVVATIITRQTCSNRSSIDLNISYVRQRDCSRGAGKLVTLDMSGRKLFDNDFVFSARTVASNIAETICMAADRLVNSGGTDKL